MNSADINIRPANVDDLDALNGVVEAAVMSWQLPERVKRLALPSYRYDELDLNYFTLIMAEEDKKIIAIAAWDSEAHLGTQGSKGLLLHGIYVQPEYQRRGMGSRLFAEAENAVRESGLDGCWLKRRMMR